MKLFKKFTREFEKQQSDGVDKLIDEIFELSKEFSNEKGEYPRSFHKFKNDIFYLDSARYEIEITLNRLGKDINKFYNNKFKPTEKDIEEDGCFANSMGAFIELFENFKELYKTVAKSDYVILNKVCKKCEEDLKEVVNILDNKEEIILFLNDTYATYAIRKKKYKERLDYISKEKIIIKMARVIELLEKSAEVLPGHIEDNNFEYARQTVNYIEEECNNLLGKIRDFLVFSESIEGEKEFINKFTLAVKKIKNIKKPLEVDISIIKMDYNCGQTPNLEGFQKDMDKLNKNLKDTEDILRTIWEEYKRFV